MFKTLLSGLVNGLLVTFGAYMAVATELGGSSSLSDIGDITWSIIVVTGVVAALKDMQAHMRKP